MKICMSLKVLWKYVLCLNTENYCLNNITKYSWFSMNVCMYIFFYECMHVHFFLLPCKKKSVSLGKERQGVQNLAFWDQSHRGYASCNCCLGWYLIGIKNWDTQLLHGFMPKREDFHNNWWVYKLLMTYGPVDLFSTH